MPALDTNVLVRWLVNDDQAQAAVVRRLLESAIGSQESLFVPITVLLELEWVLRTRYRFSRTSIELALVAMLEARELSIQSEGSVECALQLFRQSNADLADCLHVGLSAMEGQGPLLTFDRDAGKLPDALELK